MTAKRTAFLLLCVVAALFATTLVLRATREPLPFDQAEWREARSRKDYRTCFRMHADIIARFSDRKLTARELVAILGEPDRRLTPFIWRYQLKSYALIFPNDSFLGVVFDGDFVAQIRFEGG